MRDFCRRRRQKELDEARKAGLAPAALDEDGKEARVHIFLFTICDALSSSLVSVLP